MKRLFSEMGSIGACTVPNPEYREPHWSCEHVDDEYKAPFCATCGIKVQRTTYALEVSRFDGYTVPIEPAEERVVDVLCAGNVFIWMDVSILGHEVIRPSRGDGRVQWALSLYKVESGSEEDIKVNLVGVQELQKRMHEAGIRGYIAIMDGYLD
jgi:hypothetical protein